jgi:hypothetical protein
MAVALRNVFVSLRLEMSFYLLTTVETAPAEKTFFFSPAEESEPDVEYDRRKNR